MSQNQAAAWPEPVNPGDLITASLYNETVEAAKAAIGQSTEEVKTKIEEVKSELEDKLSEVDAATFGGKTPEEWSEQFAPQVHDHEGMTVYRQYFKVLRPNELVVLGHDLGRMPLVDIYQLDRFSVFCEEEEDDAVQEVTFYLYHSSEWRQKAGTSTEFLEPRDKPRGIPFAEMLARFEVPYGGESSLVDVETEFWKAFFREPNDRFEFYCHSPWFEEHCREERRVGFLDSRGDWDELKFQMRPRKTIHLTSDPVPDKIQVDQLNFRAVGITWVVPTETTGETEVMILLRI